MILCFQSSSFDSIFLSPESYTFLYSTFLRLAFPTKLVKRSIKSIQLIEFTQLITIVNIKFTSKPHCNVSVLLESYICLALHCVTVTKYTWKSSSHLAVSAPYEFSFIFVNRNKAKSSSTRNVNQSFVLENELDSFQ